eukprot:TRINITY_DN15984_c0_g1_i1.p1 TRINITY_DN15984_c0_g1~~TRINITY_DN15984_c0_g1_i1.p1  ORF type:complete len:530 (+),score=127.43 TRINITY_DN15984_c0_g1_i1:62-1651(+)
MHGIRRFLYNPSRSRNIYNKINNISNGEKKKTLVGWNMSNFKGNNSYNNSCCSDMKNYGGENLLLKRGYSQISDVYKNRVIRINNFNEKDYYCYSKKNEGFSGHYEDEFDNPYETESNLKKNDEISDNMSSYVITNKNTFEYSEMEDAVVTEENNDDYVEGYEENDDVFGDIIDSIGTISTKKIKESEKEVREKTNEFEIYEEGICYQTSYLEAEEIYKDLLEDDYQPNYKILSYMIKLCAESLQISKKDKIETRNRFDSFIETSRNQKSTSLGSAESSFLDNSNARAMKRSLQFYHKMLSLDIIPSMDNIYNILIAALRSEDIKNAEIVYQDISKHNLKVDAKALSLLIAVYAKCHDEENMIKHINLAKESNFKLDISPFPFIIDHYAELGDLENSEYYFKFFSDLDYLPNRNILNSLIKASANSNSPTKVEYYYYQFQNSQIQPSLETFSFVIDYFLKQNNVQKSEFYFRQISSNNLQPSEQIYQSFINYFSSQQLSNKEQYYRHLEYIKLINPEFKNKTLTSSELI